MPETPVAMWIAFALSIAAVVYNNVVNQWRPFHGSAYVPVNLAFAITVASVAALAFELSPAELGLQGHLRDLLLPLGLIAPVAVGAFRIASSRHAHRIVDKRVTGVNGHALAFYMLVRIPLGTAVTEELIFRGVLFAAWRESGVSDLVAALLCAVAFGLWHISPTVIGLRMNDPSASARKVQVAVIGAVLFTTVAGLGLTWLQIESGGLLGPTVLHAGINSVAAMASVVADRRREDSAPAP